MAKEWELNVPWLLTPSKRGRRLNSHQPYFPVYPGNPLASLPCASDRATRTAA